jgi:hypothetical protein
VFLGKFLLAAGLLLALWTLARASDGYSRAVLFVSDPLMWLCSGFRVDSITPTDAGLNIFIRKGTDRILLPLQPRELFSGIIPFLALIAARATSRRAHAARRRSGWPHCSRFTSG